MTPRTVTPGPIPDSYWLLEGQFLAAVTHALSQDDAREKLATFLDKAQR